MTKGVLKGAAITTSSYTIKTRLSPQGLICHKRSYSWGLSKGGLIEGGGSIKGSLIEGGLIESLRYSTFIIVFYFLYSQRFRTLRYCLKLEKREASYRKTQNIANELLLLMILLFYKIAYRQ